MHRPLTAERGPSSRRGKRPPNYGRKFPPEVLTADEVFALMACPGKVKVADRNRALCAVLWRAGLRIGEALALYPKDVNLATGFIVVLHGKGDKRRLIGLDRRTIALVKEWMLVREALEIGDDKHLFCHCFYNATMGEPLSYNSVRDMVTRAKKKAGIQKRVHLHGFRHTNAFELMLENTPPSFIQTHLGHSRLETTVRYIDHLAPIAVVQHMQAREWPKPTTLHEVDAELELLRDQAAAALEQAS